MAAGAEEGGCATGDGGLAVRYEEMRRAVLGEEGVGPHGHGVALFVRRGMAAWIRGWSECRPAAGEARAGAAGTGVPLPPALGSEVVLVLAEMVRGAELGREGTTG